MQTAIQKQNEAVRPFGTRDKLGYLLGNVANDFSFAFAGVFLMVFYTKVLGIPAQVVGTLFVAARLVDAVTDVTMGRIVDIMPSTKNGKFRPWLVRMSAPVALFSFLMYQSSLAGADIKIRTLYMAVTYLLWGSVFYTSINIPYGSMASVISNNPSDRASLSTARSIGSQVANLFVGIAVPLAVYTVDSAGNQIVNASAFPKVALILSVLSFLMYLACYKLTAERVVIPPKHEHAPIGRTLKTLVTDRALIGIVVASISMLAAQLLSQSINQYLFIDYFNDKNGVMLISAIGMIPAFILAPAAVPITKRIGKKEIGVIGCLIGSAACLILYLIRTSSVWVYIAFSVATFGGLAVFNLVTWAFITDVIDDREVRTGHRDDGTVYAVYSFARKLGQAIAGGLGGWTLSAIGFNEAAQVQSEAVANGIYSVATLIPAVLYLAVALSLFFIYPLGKKRVEENQAALHKKHM